MIRPLPDRSGGPQRRLARWSAWIAAALVALSVALGVGTLLG